MISRCKEQYTTRRLLPTHSLLHGTSPTTPSYAFLIAPLTDNGHTPVNFPGLKAALKAQAIRRVFLKIKLFCFARADFGANNS